jgi:rare lipoprotein A (peptidoglycan hydrolase)
MLRFKLARLRSALLFSLLGLLLGTFDCRSALAGIGSKPTRWQQVTNASWYGHEFAGQPAANGQPFDPNRLTAAHRSLPLGKWVRVTEVGSKRSVIVQITDRGPFQRNRGIDLSYAAAQRLGMVRRGVAKVRIELMEEETASQTILPVVHGATVATVMPSLLPDTTIRWRRQGVQYSQSAQRSELRS